jgi:anhydro-N-acetylmuramic acid kinase
MSDLCIGMISGTSVDGIDVALVEIDGHGQDATIRTIGFETVPYPEPVRNELLALYDDQANAVARLCSLNVVVGECFASAALATCARFGVDPAALRVIGSHGQTVWHQPLGETPASVSLPLVPSTLQIGEPSVIAAATGAPVVADFRVADMAVGGQGAPLAPYLDWAALGDANHSRCVQNIGGIGNVTWVPAGGDRDAVLAFDTGPGNILIDALVTLLTGGAETFDRDGVHAARGAVDAAMLAELMEDPYLAQRPPKTTGRELYGMAQARAWIAHRGLPGDALSGSDPVALRAARDLVATVTAWTAESIADAYRRYLPALPDAVFVNGGGARNPTLMRMLAERLPGIPVAPTDSAGIDADAKEAIAFALMAHDALAGLPTNIPGATGARRAVPLGKVVRIPAAGASPDMR